MQFAHFLFILFIGVGSLMGQEPIDKALEKWNVGSVPYIYVDEIGELTNFILLDTRAKEEYDVSRLKDAIWVGYDTFQADSVTTLIPDKETPILVYCSIGVRSEDIGERLLKLGYIDVKNLYGGIFEWKNQGKTVVDEQGNATKKVHAFDKEWGKLLKKGKKVYKR